MKKQKESKFKVDYTKVLEEFNLPRITQLDKLTESKYVELKKRIKNSSDCGYIDYYFDRDALVWMEPEFEGCGWLWGIADTYGRDVYVVLKDRMLRTLKGYLKQGAYVVDKGGSFYIIEKRKVLPAGCELYASAFYLNKEVDCSGF